MSATTTTTAAPLVVFDARAAAAELAAPRFRGRAKLIRELRVLARSAAYGGWYRDQAERFLRALEAVSAPQIREAALQAAQRVRPGAPADEIARAILGAARDTELAARAEACLLPWQARASEERARGAAVRAARAAQRAARKDSLATKVAGEVLARYIERRARVALRRADFRQTRHGATERVVVVAEGAEGASSTVFEARPRELGLPGAYARKAFWVSCSQHELWVSLATARLADRAEQGVLYLRADLRVVQGRGTSLVCERLIAGRGGALRWVRA
jgi:hypothetical protein